MWRGLHLALFAMALSACGHAAPPPAVAQAPAATPPGDAAVATKPADGATGLDGEPEQLASRTIDLFRACGRALADAKDCADAATKLGAVIDANRDVIAASARLRHAQGDGQRALNRALEKRSTELIEASKSFVEAPIVKQCASDKAFIATVERLRGDSP